MSENSSGWLSAEEMRNAQDKIDLMMPDIVSEAMEVEEWDQEIAVNFIRRAYARGVGDGLEVLNDEADQ